MEDNKANVCKLVSLIANNPALSVVPIVGSDVFNRCYDDSDACKISESYIGEIIYIPFLKRTVVKKESTMFSILCYYYGLTYFDELMKDNSNEELERIFNLLPWEKVIIVEIDPMEQEDMEVDT